MRKFFMVLVFCGLSSCNLFESKEEKTQELVEQELQGIDWNDLDHYPLFDECEEVVSKEEQKSCFENKLVFHLSADLQEFQLVSERNIKDVVFLDFMLESDGGIAIVSIENQEILGNQAASFRQRIRQSLDRLPKIEPALKRGVPVRAKFRIPIFLNSK